jgi:hypothetical protein
LISFSRSVVSDYSIDLLEEPIDPTAPESDEGQVIRSVLDKAVAGEWESFSPPGAGAEWRMETKELAAASLVWNDEVVVHLQAFPKHPESGAVKKTFGRRARTK